MDLRAHTREHLKRIALGQVPGRRLGIAALLRGLWKGYQSCYYPRLIRKYQRSVTKLSRPVISVGNISFGGTGKTPMVQFLAEFAKQRGFYPAIVSRGYGGTFRGDVGLVSDGAELLMSVAEAGDEAVLHARRLRGIPVVISRNRATGGRFAIEQLRANIILLDDGFQFWSLHRELDFVLVDPGTCATWLLREPATALSRAHLIGLTKTESLDEKARTEIHSWVRVCAEPGAPFIFEVKHRVSGLMDSTWQPDGGIEQIAGKRVYLFCSIADPEAFVRTVLECGALIAGTRCYPDHYRYRERDFDGIQHSAGDHKVDLVLTTEKDLVKIAPGAWRLPLKALRIEMEIVEGRSIVERTVLDALMQ